MSPQGRENPIELSALRVSGPDARSFLQSQLTSDVERGGEALRPTAWCNPKGRVEAFLLIAERDDHFDLVLPDPIAEDVLAKLGMFRIGRRVEIASAGAVVPAAPNSPGARQLAFDPDRALRVAGGEVSPLPSAWLARDIECALPWILAPARGRFLPQMLGLDALGGLSYRKGCFPGQEVIARVHYRGRVTQRPARVRIVDGTLSPGTEFGLPSGTGTILYAAAATDGDIALAVVPSEAVAGERIGDVEATGELLN